MARKLAWILLAAPLAACAIEEGARLDRLPSDVRPNDLISLQRGAQLFVNYCQGCHSAGYMRYSRLRDLELTEQQIRDNLVLTGAKVGDYLRAAMDPREAKDWFGAAPPDLTVIARSRSSSAGSGADWLYTYLRGFYRDGSRPTGWNNLVFENVGMPHVFWQQNGQQALVTRQFDTRGAARAALLQSQTVARVDPITVKDESGRDARRYLLKTLRTDAAGTMAAPEYDRMVADLVNFLVYMGEPARQYRIELGIYVLMFLAALLVLSYLVKREYWKDVH